MTYTKIYLILVHKNPHQVKLMIDMLSDGKSVFFIHVDKKSDIDAFRNVIDCEEVYYVNHRVKCYWGTFSLVKATLNGLNEIRKFAADNAISQYHCILLSGEDMPLWNNNKIHDLLCSQPETTFMDYWQLPDSRWWGGGLYRFESVYMFDHKKYPKRNASLNRFLSKIGFTSLLPSERIRKFDSGLQLFGSSQWMILSAPAVKLLLDGLVEKNNTAKLFHYVLAPDEVFFPTLLHYFDRKKILDIKLFKTHLVIFEGNAPSPVYLKTADIENHNDTIPFSRKFDPAVNPETIALIEKKIRQ